MPDNKGSQTDEFAVDPFPLWVLPEPLANFVVEASHAISCPPDYIAAPMFSTLSTAIGTGHCIQIKEGWFEWPILWTATIGDTGTAKSPAQVQGC
jgi:hypothetical protein